MIYPIKRIASSGSIPDDLSYDDRMLHFISSGHFTNKGFSERGFIKRDYRPLSGLEINFNGIDLSGSIFRGMDLRKFSFRGAFLYNADMSDCDLRSVDLTGAVFQEVNLNNSDLSKAKIERIILKDANLIGAKIDLKSTLNETGPVIVYKTGLEYKMLGDVNEPLMYREKSKITLITLMIHPSSQRTIYSTENKYRCETATVIRIQKVYSNNIIGVDINDCVNLTYRPEIKNDIGQVLGFVFYRVGEQITANNWNPDIRTPYGGGIHFFLKKEEAIRFAEWAIRQL